jgi:hypothetical protein
MKDAKHVGLDVHQAAISAGFIAKGPAPLAVDTTGQEG